MKTSALILFISAAFLISTATCDPCADSYNFADVSINNLRNNFFNNMFENMYEDFENIMKSAELIQDTCSSSVDFSIQVNQLFTCSLAYSMLSEVFGLYRFETESQMTTVLGQIVSLIPTIEGKFCMEEWEVTTLQNQQLDNDFWVDNDPSDDYSYDSTDNGDFMVEDEEDEDTGDEISGDLDEEIVSTMNVPEDEEKVVIADWTVMKENEESDDEDEEEEEDDLVAHAKDSEDDSIMVFVEIPKSSEEDFDVIVADVTNEDTSIFIENEDHLAIPFGEVPLTKEDEDMIMVFVDMTNMNTETELEFGVDAEGELSLSVYVDMSGEVFLADNMEDSLFVFVDANTSAAIDQMMDIIFSDEDSDMDVVIGELDLSKYWGDEEEEEESLGDF